MRGSHIVCLPSPTHPRRISDVHGLFVRTEAEAVGLLDAISNDANIVALRVPTIYLAWELWSWSELLFVPVRRISEPDRPVPGHYHIVDRVEQAPVIARENMLCFERWVDTHCSQTARLSVRTLCTEQYAICRRIVDSAIAHECRTVWNFVKLPCVIVLALSSQFEDRDGGSAESIACDKERILGAPRDKYSGFVEERLLALKDQAKGRKVAKQFMAAGLVSYKLCFRGRAALWLLGFEVVGGHVLFSPLD